MIPRPGQRKQVAIKTPATRTNRSDAPIDFTGWGVTLALRWKALSSRTNPIRDSTCRKTSLSPPGGLRCQISTESTGAARQ
jgi:hypothetical protein